MGYDSEQKSGGAAIVIIVIVAMLLLGALLVVGVGAFFFVRVSSMEQRAMVQQERAVMKAMESRAAQEAIQQAIAQDRQADQAALPEETTLTPLSTAALTIVLQQDGRLIVDDMEFTQEALQNRLQDSPPESVTIQADPQCPAKHVVELLALCRQAGVQQLDIKGP